MNCVCRKFLFVGHVHLQTVVCIDCTSTIRINCRTDVGKYPCFHCNSRQNDGIIENVVSIRLSMKLDSNDLKLIELLKQDSRASVTSLADSMGIARVTTHDRMVRLKREGIIRRYTVDIDARAWGYELRAFIFARCDRGNVDRRDVAKKICAFPYVVRCNVIAGDWDLLIEVVSPSMDSLGDAILDGLSKVGGIASTQTMVSFYDYSGPASSLR